MALSLDIDATCPFVQILDAVAAKIVNPALSFVKYLAAEGLPEVTIFDQTLEADGRHCYDPPLSLCPAVSILTSGFPPVTDRGIGSEIWHFEVAIAFKMDLPAKDSRVGLAAFWELIRTVMAGHKQAQIDPLNIALAGSLADYTIADEIQPPTSTERDGFRVARGMFIMQFRVAESVLA